MKKLKWYTVQVYIEGETGEVINYCDKDWYIINKTKNTYYVKRCIEYVYKCRRKWKQRELFGVSES